MIKVLIIAGSKQAGGAEKSAIKLANSLSSYYSVAFGTFFQGNGDFYSSPSTNEISFFKFTNIIRNSLPKFILMFVKYTFIPIDLLLMRRKIKNNDFDLVISFGAGVGCVTYLSLIFSNIPQITSERISPDKNIYRPSLVARLLRPWIYKHGVICSVQTKGFKDIVKSMWGVEGFITPNHFEIPNSFYSPQPSSSPCIAVGRPALQKGYDLLISSWAILESRIDNELWIVADDSDNYIKSLIKINGVNNVRIRPLSNNLYEVYRDCSLFISTSRFEGYPNAIAEAIIFGIPVLTTVNSDVVNDWFELGICQKIESLNSLQIASTIENALKNENQLRSISKKAIETRSSFSWENTKKSWEEIIAIALNSTSNTR
jgi:GalNAc-alpha-(1->4)-GalNAc-alpha-(1->3)-diNAcBac-PP-undecaprenol alpha-1,4-N-acetyl-D-galactosaminyltransferase